MSGKRRRVSSTTKTTVTKTKRAVRRKPKAKVGRKPRRRLQRPVSAGVGLLTSIPRKLFAKLCYMTTIGFEGDAMTGAWQPLGTAGPTTNAGVFRLTDLFDPQFATGGHQPLGRDRLATYYQRYVVFGCTIQLSMAMVGLQTVQQCMMWPFITGPSTTLPTGYRRAIENKMSGWKWVTRAGGTYSSYFSPPTAVWKRYVSMSKMRGRPIDQENDSSSFAATGIDDVQLNILTRIPGANELGEVDWVPSPLAATTSRVQIDLKLTYHIKAYNPIGELVQS